MQTCAHPFSAWAICLTPIEVSTKLVSSQPFFSYLQVLEDVLDLCQLLLEQLSRLQSPTVTAVCPVSLKASSLGVSAKRSGCGRNGSQCRDGRLREAGAEEASTTGAISMVDMSS